MKGLKSKACSLGIISYYIGYIVLCITVLMAIPLITALGFREWDTVLNFVISMSISAIVGFSMVLFGMNKKGKNVTVQWKHGFVVASLSWIILTLLCAIPYRLSGHTNSYIDACFDVMSGFTTTGLALTQDLDHISNGFNMWRHLLTFLGGQGMVVLALTLLVKETAGAYKMYVGEGKDIELVPNVKGTTRLIWKISMIYLIFGTVILWINGILIGLKPLSAFIHALYMFVSSWSTGGFAPMSQNIMYYHSMSYEMVTMVIFTLGSFNFGLHYAIWKGNRKEIFKNIETRSFFITSFILTTLALLAIEKRGVYQDAIAGIRRVVFNLISAHTTTGLGSIYARQFESDWGDFGILVLIIAMMIGGSACSTAGGIKGLRVGIVAKGLIKDIKKLLTSERSMRVYKYHHIKDQLLEDGIIKASAIIICCYIITFTIGTLIGTYYGYSFSNAAFESASITGNVGLSIGVTSPTMPTLMKVYYIIAMYLGRLEFLSAFALIGYIAGGIKKVWVNSVKQ